MWNWIHADQQKTEQWVTKAMAFYLLDASNDEGIDCGHGNADKKDDLINKSTDLQSFDGMENFEYSESSPEHHSELLTQNLKVKFRSIELF